MDQDSSNGAGADKRNWRERLGIGAKELPKLSDEFRDEPQAAPPPPAGTARPAPRAPVTKPAPMAPRVAAKTGSAVEGSASSAASVPPPLSRATPKVPDNATQDALAEKLRAQRAAAERLAEQRVQAARNRAESKPRVDPIPPRPTPAAPSPRPAAPASRTPAVTPPLPGSPRPKFNFADENRQDPAQRPGLGGPAPLTPPRPALGGDRGQPAFLRPGAGSGTNGSLGARPQPAFRPTNTEGGSGYLAPPRLQPPAAPRSGLGSDAAGYGGSRLPVRRPPPTLDPYVRQQPAAEPREYPEDDYDDEGRAPPRLGRPAVAGRGRAAQDDFEEVFEEDQVPRGRAAARDYQQPYGDGEEGFADEPRRSSGPWLLLLALLAAALLTGAVVWFYSDSVKHLAGIGSSTSSGSTPVVPAPAEPAKIAAPDAAAGDGQTEAPAARKKQIYDRIVGEQEVTGQMQPTEETPVSPDAAQPAAGQPAAGQPAAAVDQVPKIVPAGNANQIPVPDAPSQGTTQGLPDPEPPAPLPLPDSGGDGKQGNLGLKGGSQVAAASAQPDQGSTAPPPPPPATSQTSSSDATLPPPPEKATDGAALVSGGDSTGSGMVSGDNQTASDTSTPVTPPAKPAASKTASTQATSQSQPANTTPAKKKTATKKSTTAQPNYNNLGSAPVVLVPPSKQAAAQSQTYAAQPAPAPVTTAPATAVQQPATADGTPQKRKSIFDLFNGGSGSTAASGTTPAASSQVASAATQTKQAATPVTQPKTAAPPAAQPQAATGGGYVVQLASFRTDTEAKLEYSRLAKSYPGIVGPLKSQIRQATVGGSTRYQLGLGPLPTRGDATRVCGQLIEAGESDCIVRGP